MRWVEGIERGLGWTATAVVCALIVIEIGLLFVGVVARYVFDSPIVWSGELSGVLFLWVSALGAVVALRRTEHMRLKAVLDKAPETMRHRLEIAIFLTIIGVCVALMHPAWQYFNQQSYITDPALDISDKWRVLALPVAFALMALSALTQLLSVARWRDFFWAAPVLLILLAGIVIAGPHLAPLHNWNLLLYFGVLLPTLVVVGTPIAFGFVIATLLYLLNTTTIPLSIVVGRMDAGMSDHILLAVPLFVFLGSLIEITGIARALVTFLLSLVGHFRAGLSYVLIGAMYLVSGISGSKAADMAAVSPILRPAADERGESEGEFVALMASSGAMAETIPPSLVLITIGSVTGVSISALFAGGLLPAAVGALALAILCGWNARRRAVTVSQAASGQERLKAFVIAIPALILPLVIRIAVVEGVATATEVATVGIVYSVVVGLFIYRRFNYRRLIPALIETASLSGAIMIIIGCATAMSWALTQSGFSHDLAAGAAVVPGGNAGFMAVSIIGFVLLGSFLEGIPAIVLFAPLLFPVAQSLGINEVHYAMVAVLAMGVGLFAPPFGVGFYAACAIGKASPDVAMRRIWPYLAVLLLSVVLIAAVPWFSTAFLG